MLKILIVDDEELIRNGIAVKVQKLIPHANICGKAADAFEALELIREHLPQIVITDIRMPQMDGLQLIEKVKGLYPDIKFILLSGYEDFTYAKKAIHLGVGDYLLKPVNNQELKAIIEKMETDLAKENDLHCLIEKYKANSKSTLDIQRSKFLSETIQNSEETDIKYTLKALAQMEISFNHPQYTAVTILLGHFNNQNAYFNKEDAALLNFCIVNITEEILSSAGSVTAFENTKKQNQVVAIINHEQADHVKITRLCKSIIDALNLHLQLNVSIGIGRSYDQLHFLRTTYHESFTAALQKITRGENNVICYDEVQHTNGASYFLNDHERLQLISYIQSNLPENAMEVLGKRFSKIEESGTSYAGIKTFIMDIYTTLGRVIKEHGGSSEDIFKEDIFSEDYITNFTTMKQLHDWLRQCLASICSYIARLDKSDGRQIIEKILEHLSNNYSAEITLNSMAKKYFINPSYLSQLFKNEVGEKFVDYVARLRIEKSKELLSGTTLPVYKIAEMIGYSDSRYFSDVFVKLAGITPSKFREKQSSS